MTILRFLRKYREHGNYAYVTTRVRARRAELQPRENYEKMLMLSLPELSRTIGESSYRAEIEELAPRYGSVDLIEWATSLNLAHNFRQILGWCEGELQAMVALYLRRWDVANLKVILRGKSNGIPVQEILEDIVAAGEFSYEYLAALANIENLADVIDNLSQTDYHSVIASGRGEGGQLDLASVENQLDKAYYANLFRVVTPTSPANLQFLNFLRHEVDVVNLRTLFKMKAEDLAAEQVLENLVRGGIELPDADLRRLASAEGLDGLVTELASLPVYEQLREAVESMGAAKDLSPVLSALDHYMLRFSAKLASLYPLSALPVLAFIIHKRAEADNIRIIARGLDRGLDHATIRAMLRT